MAPPINPFACTKSMSLIPETSISFCWSLIPLHSCFKGFLNSNEPSFKATAWILHFWFVFSGKTTKRISPSSFSSSSIWTMHFCQGTYLVNKMIFPEGWTSFLWLNDSLTIDLVWIPPLYDKINYSKICLTSLYISSRPISIPFRNCDIS